MEYGARVASSEDIGGGATPHSVKNFWGSTVYLTGREEQALLALSIERGPGSLGQPLLAEFIGSCQLGAAETLAQLQIPPTENTVTATMPLLQAGRDQESCTVRARVRLERDGDTDYLAYTNHIRLVLD